MLFYVVIRLVVVVTLMKAVLSSNATRAIPGSTQGIGKISPPLHHDLAPKIEGKVEQPTHLNQENILENDINESQTLAMLVACGSRSECREAMFAFLAQQRVAKHEALLAAWLKMKHGPSAESADAWLRRLSPQSQHSVPRVAAALHFARFFFKFELTSRPVVLERSPFAEQRLPEKCLKLLLSGRASTGDAFSLPQVCDVAVMASAAANDYLQRAPSPFRDFWPVAVTGTRASKTQELHSCPFGLHMLVAVLQGRLHAVLFPRNDTLLLGPDFTRQPSTPSSQPRHTRHAVPWRYKLDPFHPDVSALPWVLGSRPVSATLAPGETLFVPAEAPVAWKFLDDDVLALVHCYADASNLQTVKERLELESLAPDGGDGPATRAQPKRALLAILNGQEFPAHMAKYPPLKLPWGVYKGTSKTAPESSGTQHQGQESSGTQHQDQDRFQRWQTERIWARTVHGLTKTRPMAPQVVKVGRSNATLRWHGVGSAADKRRWLRGYDVTWSGTEGAQGRLRLRYDRHRRQLRGADAFTGSQAIYCRVTGLRASKIYTFQVVSITDMGEFPSSASLPVRTQAGSAPARLEEAPEAFGQDRVRLRWGQCDDGGSPITHFVIRFAGLELKRNGPSLLPWGEVELPWGEGSGESTARQHETALKDLIPGMQYVFAVAARNGLGTGPFSAQSAAFSVPATALSSVSGQSSPVLPCFGPRAVLSDRRQQLRVQLSGDDAIQMDVWAAHHSPKRFDVTAELMWAGAAELKGRVAVAERGRVPLRKIVQNAQRQGALGVAIIDNTRRCDAAFDQHCCAGGTKRLGEGFAAQDHALAWQSIRIPAVLLKFADGQKLTKLLRK